MKNYVNVNLPNVLILILIGIALTFNTNFLNKFLFDPIYTIFPVENSRQMASSMYDVKSNKNLYITRVIYILHLDYAVT